MKEKKVRCLDCEHFTFDSGYPAWSDMTPGSDWRMGCVIWNMSGDDYPTQEEFINQLNQHRICDTYHKRKKEVEKNG